MPDVFNLKELEFKGSRAYVHGTDLFGAISVFFDNYGAGFVKDLSFRFFANHQCRIHLHSLEDSAAKVVCQGRWHNINSGLDTRFWVTESEKSITGRYEFDEDALYAGAEIKSTGIQRGFNSKFSMIENIVALTKYYHNIKLPVSSGKWVFGQLLLNETLPNECTSIEIENYQNIKDRFSRNHIALNGQRFGEIRFIVS